MTHDKQSPRRADNREDLDRLIGRSTARISLDALIKSGRTEFRVVKRKDLLRELFDVVEAFIDNKMKAAEREMSSLVSRREEDAREDGKMRVLTSLADLGDLVDNVVGALAGSDAGAAGKALDKRLDRIFRSYDFERIPTVGQPFDPALHEAVDDEPSNCHAEGFIARELARGYRRGAFVLRVARVIVSTGQA